MNRQLTMLIVDDMEVERISFAEIFKDEYQILEAENGKQAMEQLEQQKVHIVLLDLCMPVMDGFEVIREMKQQDKYADIPIVAKTAIDEKTEVKALEAGADEYIFSPCDPAIVKKRVHNLVEKYILEREKIRAQLEKEQEMGRAKELFLARMSHELRTPINGILGISQLAHYKDAEVREDFKKIRYQAEYLWELVNDVLDMAAIDNGKMTIRHVAFSLNEVVSEVSGLFYSQCRMKRIYFYFRVDNVTHEYLIGDAIRVKQVLVNLLSNSFKFTEKGGTIEVCMSELDVDDSRTVLHITVRDTGCGISDKALEKIWEPFEQEQHENGKYYGGSGLGLPIIKSIVEQMHGTIDVASEYNVGSKFIVDIPFEIGKSIVREKRKFRSLKVFLVNNDEIALHYMMSTLTRLGIRYDSSTDGKEIIRILKEAYERGEGYDICFVNWQMPGGYGKKLVREMREIFDRDTLKIVTSSYDTEDYEEEMRGAGVDYILKKPVLQSQVYSLISEICSVPEAEKNKTEDYDFTGKRALLAEDNAVNAEVFQGFLKAVNAEVECADNGEAALSRYQNMPDYYYDMIFMDAAKGQYINWLPDVMRLMKNGGGLISDNVLQEGDIIESHYLVERRNRTIYKRMREYLYELKHNPSLITSIIPLGDGVTVSVKQE